MGSPRDMTRAVFILMLCMLAPGLLAQEEELPRFEIKRGGGEDARHGQARARNGTESAARSMAAPEGAARVHAAARQGPVDNPRFRDTLWPARVLWP